MSAHHLGRKPSLMIEIMSSKQLRNEAALGDETTTRHRSSTATSTTVGGGYVSSESETTVASSDRMDSNDNNNGDDEEAKRRRRKRRDRLRGSMAIQVYPPTWAVAESNNLLWLMRMPWRLLVEVRIPPRSSNQSELITFLRVDSYIDVRPSAQRTSCCWNAKRISLTLTYLPTHKHTYISQVQEVCYDAASNFTPEFWVHTTLLVSPRYLDQAVVTRMIVPENQKVKNNNIVRTRAAF